MSNKVTAWVDGSCSLSGRGGWGSVILEDGQLRLLSGTEEGTTNNRQEIRALLEVLKLLRPDQPACILSDSMYVVRSVNDWLPRWVKEGYCTSAGHPIANVDLWQEMKLVLDTLDRKIVRIGWVGRNSTPEMHLADSLAKHEAGLLKTTLRQKNFTKLKESVYETHSSTGHRTSSDDSPTSGAA